MRDKAIEKLWDQYYEYYSGRIKKLTYLCGADDSMVKNLIEEKTKQDDKINKALSVLKEQLNISVEEVMSFAGPRSSLFDLTEEELKERVPYYIQLFGTKKKFKEIMQSCEVSTQGSTFKGLFSYKGKDLVARKIEWLGALFGIGYNAVVDLMISSAYYIYCSPEFLKDKIERFSKLLQISEQEFKTIWAKYPYVLQRDLGKLEENFQRFAAEFQSNEKAIAEMCVKYPPFIYWNISELRSIFGIAKQQKPGAEKKAIIEDLLARKIAARAEPTQSAENSDIFDEILSLDELFEEEDKDEEGDD